MSFLKNLFRFTEGVIDIPINTNPPLATKEKIEERVDLVYFDELPKVCTLDTYFIPGKDKYPVMLYIHGGGFVAGDKHKRRGICRWYASLGFYVFNINYGLCPEFSYPEPVKHCVYALNWVESRAAQYKLDLSHFAVSGDSAGAYYAAMLAAITTDRQLAMRLDVSPRVTVGAAVLNCGLYDIEHIMQQRIVFNVNALIFQNFSGVADGDLANYRYRNCCSPVEHITHDFPPTFMLYAKQDMFCAGQTERLCDALKKENVYCEEFHSDGFFTNHCFSLLWSNRKSQEANHLVASFLHDFVNDSITTRNPGDETVELQNNTEILLDDSQEDDEPEYYNVDSPDKPSD